jgi:GSH-dependent disulfide-bond oxidoreductase
MPIELYTANTPNSQRVVIVLEELALPYSQRKIDIFAGGAKTPEFLKLNPNGALPVIVDPDGPGGAPVTPTQGWLICLYLAEKTGKYIPTDPLGRLRVQEALFHLASDVMMVHTTHNTLSRFVPEKVPSTIAWYEDRVVAALNNLDRQLGERKYLAGDDLSIADFAFYPVYNRRRGLVEQHPEFVNLARWGKEMDVRPACRRGVEATQ